MKPFDMKGNDMEPMSLWRQQVLARLEHGMGRAMLEMDLACLIWNDAAQTLTVQSAPLLNELRARNLISNVFRSRNLRMERHACS